MTPKDWTLLVLVAAGKPVSPVQLQKSLFLLGRNLGASQLGQPFYQFQAYDYGPFCQQVYADAEGLECAGDVVITSGGRYREYAATPSGVERAAKLRKGLDPVAATYLDEVVRWVRARSFNELVKAIYRAYPEMKANSVFRQ